MSFKKGFKLKADKLHECLICNKEFFTSRYNAKVCSEQCRKKLKNISISQKLHDSGIENVDYVTCKWCGLNVKRIFGSHMRFYHPDKKTGDYAKEFPNVKITCKNDANNLAKAYVRFTKSEKGRRFFAERMRGENNINSKTNATVEQRKSRSPFSSSFYMKRGMNEEESKVCVNNFAKKTAANTIGNTHIEYYIMKANGDMEKAKKMLSERQHTFSLIKCIKRYGEEIGTQKWLDRQKRWFKSYKKSNFSKISQKLFLSLYEIIEDKEVYFAYCNFGNLDFSGRNNEYTLVLENRIVKPDFFFPKKRRIIEFDGVYYHRNTPENKTWSQKRDIDIIKSGYSILHISELDYKNDPLSIVESCKKFLEQ